MVEFFFFRIDKWMRDFREFYSGKPMLLVMWVLGEMLKFSWKKCFQREKNDMKSTHGRLKMWQMKNILSLVSWLERQGITKKPLSLLSTELTPPIHNNFVPFITFSSFLIFVKGWRNQFLWQFLCVSAP